MDRAWTCIVAVVVNACHSTAEPLPETPANKERNEPTLSEPHVAEKQPERRPLTDYVAAGGLRWLVVGAPRRLLATLGPDVHKLLPRDRLQAFRKHHGIDLSAAHTGLIAHYESSTVYLLDDSANQKAAARFIQQLDSEPAIVRPSPELLRIRGTIDGAPRSLIELQGRAFAIVAGDFRAAAIVEQYAQRRLESPSALHGAALSKLPRQAHQAMLRAYAPGPLPEYWLSQDNQLLSQVLAAGVTMDVDGSELATRFYIHGAFPQRSELLVADAYRNAMHGRLGRLLGTDTPFDIQSQELASGRLHTITTRWDKKRLISGIYALVRGDAKDLFQLPEAQR